MSDFQPNITDYKILLTVSYLNENGFYPLSEGVYKIVTGIVDTETSSFCKCPTFQTLISSNSKRISRLILMLLRYGYLEKIFDRSSNELYLHITSQGKRFLIEYPLTHKINLNKKEIIKKPTIVSIK